MKRILLSLTLVFSLGAPMAGCAFAQEAVSPPITYEFDAAKLEPLKIVSGETVHEFNIELADDPEERALGLMHRKEMAPDQGMLFTYERPQKAGVWMKNTLISLDMLFVSGDGTIVAIAKNARPGSLRIIDSGFQVKGFLEINGGQADVMGIKPGDMIQHKAFANTQANGG